PAAAKAHAELAIVHGQPAERRLGHPGTPTELLDLEKQRFPALHFTPAPSPPRPEGVSMSSGDDTPVHGKKQILFCPLSSPNIGVGRIPPWTTVANVGGASVESPFVARRRNAKISQRGPFGRRARFREGGGGEMELYVWSWGFLFLYIGGMLVLGWLGSRRVASADDFATARRGYGPLMLALAFASTAASGATFLGLPGLTYTYGTSTLWIAFCYSVGVYIGIMICQRAIA